MVASNWMTLTDSEEHAILEDCAKKSYRLSFAYFSYLAFSAFCFSQFSIINPVLDLILPTNGSRPKLLVVRAEYILDPYDYFYELHILYTMSGVIVATVASATDSTYNAMVHQCAGTFRIVQHRLVKATTYSNHEVARKTMVSAIELHKQSLHFVEILESSYSFYFLLLIGATMMLTISICAVVDCLNEPLIVIKFFLFGIAFVIHLFYISYPGQLVIDESENIFHRTYHNSWYESSKEVKQMLLIVMKRCLKPSVVTAGGLYVLSLENAGKIFKTAISYMTFALSLN